jgi:3-hydroxyisobutyrate dehydrogenase
MWGTVIGDGAKEVFMIVTVLGTGTMGAGMARSLRRSGHDVRAWNRTASKAEPLAADGIEVADSVGAAVTGADAVITIVFDVDAVLSVAPELTGALSGDAVWLQSATVGPDGIRRIRDETGSTQLLDAPMLGTKEPAEQGKLVPIVSGDPGLVARAQPVLDAVGAKTVVAGDQLGDASALKLACNAWIFAITAATGQSLALAAALGVDPELFLQAIDGGPANTAYAQLKGKAILAGDFSPSFGLDGARKDLALIAAAASGAKVDTALVDGLRALFDAASSQGHGGDDMSAVYAAFV